MGGPSGPMLSFQIARR
ncbi:DUF6053 domain-containing protein [Lysobacter enzymogenes]